jgi:hypothetical protein
MFGLPKNSAHKWCCMGFEGNYEQAGQRGFSVLIEKGKFLLQARAVEQSDQERLHGQLETADYPVSSVIQTGMQFCPWCGVNLMHFYGKRTAELDRPGFSVASL